MGTTLRGRYAEFPLLYASLSSSVPATTKFETSAMCTPSSHVASGKPFSFACSGVSGVTLIASSKSFASGGSIVMMSSLVRSSLSLGISLSLNVRDTSLAWSVTSVGNLSSRL